jgi:hypothetical protein
MRSLLAGEGYPAAGPKLIWVRGSCQQNPLIRRLRRHLLPQGEKGKKTSYATVKNGSGAPSVGLNTTFTFWPIFSFSISQSTKLVRSDGPSFSVT